MNNEPNNPNDMPTSHPVTIYQAVRTNQPNAGGNGLVALPSPGYVVVEAEPTGRVGPGFAGGRPQETEQACNLTAVPPGLPNWTTASGRAQLNNPKGLYEGVSIGHGRQCSWQDLHLAACRIADSEPIAYITCGAEITDGDFLEGIRNKGITRALLKRLPEYTPQQSVITGNPVPNGFRALIPPPGGFQSALLGVTFELTIPPINFNAVIVNLYLGDSVTGAGAPVVLAASPANLLSPQIIPTPRFVQIRMLSPRARVVVLTAVRRGKGMTLPQHTLDAWPIEENALIPIVADAIGLPPQAQMQVQAITNNTIAAAELSGLVEV